MDGFKRYVKDCLQASKIKTSCVLCFILDPPPNADVKLFYMAAKEDNEILMRKLLEARVIFEE